MIVHCFISELCLYYIQIHSSWTIDSVKNLCHVSAINWYCA